MHKKLENIYFNALKLSRNEKIYSFFGVSDNILNKIYIFFIHISVYFNKDFFLDPRERQAFFDFAFNRIETDLREMGIGDMALNKKMKILVSKFYSILVDFKDFGELSQNKKNILLEKYINFDNKNNGFVDYLTNYFLKN